MTVRHVPPHPNRALIVVADRARARLFSTAWPTLTDWQEVADLTHPAGAVRESETRSDSPGRFRTPAGHLASGESETDYKHKTAMEFAREIVERLEHGRQQGNFDHLVLVSPPTFLGVLREHLTDSLTRLVSLEINKELTLATAPEIQERLREDIATTEA